MVSIPAPSHPALRHGPWYRGIRGQLALSFGLAFVAIFITIDLIGFFGIPGTRFIGRVGYFKIEAGRSLELVADLKEERLRWWIEERHNDLRLFLGSPARTAQVQSLLRAIDQLDAKNLPDKLSWEPLRKLPDYRPLTTRLSEILHICPQYRRIFIADARSARIIASTDKADLGADVAGQAFIAEPIESGSDYIGDALIIDKNQAPVFHVSGGMRTPEGRLIAVMVLEIETEAAFKPLLHTGEGLGQRGEALLVNGQRQILVSLKHPVNGDQRPKPLQYRLDTEPAKLAAAGQRGTIDGLDYRGVSVLAAYRPIQITPELNWGLVVKRDRKELFAPLYHELYQAALLGLVGIAIFVLVTMVVARNVARPLRALAQTAAHVSGGDLSARAPVSTDDEVGMLAGTFNEMVQRIQDWEEVMVRQERLAALGQLIATVSHELRNPLGTIRTSFFVIAKQIRAAELGVTPALDRIDRSITRCDGIISDLLDYSSNQPVQTKPTEIDPWLASTLDEYETPPQIELCRNLAAGVTIPLDPDRFHRCMLNLLSNACESIESGKGRVTVASCVEDGHVAIRVADTGCGIPADQIHKIFEPLYSTKSFGVGLGVPIIKQIVDRHNGSIEVESQPGRGTTFVVRLPLDLHQEKESSHE